MVTAWWALLASRGQGHYDVSSGQHRPRQQQQKYLAPSVSRAEAEEPQSLPQADACQRFRRDALVHPPLLGSRTMAPEPVTMVPYSTKGILLT